MQRNKHMSQTQRTSKQKKHLWEFPDVENIRDFKADIIIMVKEQKKNTCLMK